MWDKIKALALKYREIILYLVFGGLTTVVNIAVYYAVSELMRVLLRGTAISAGAALGLEVNTANVAAFILSVLFAYITNRRYVFRSTTRGAAARREILSFFGARIATWGLDEINMNVFVTWLHMNGLLIKVLSNIVVILANYALSKLIIFRRREQAEEAAKPEARIDISAK